MSSHVPSEWFGGALILLFIGIIAIILGFRAYSRFKLMETVPTSKIRSIAMGLVEIFGGAEKFKKFFKSPLTTEKCVWWRILVEKYVKRGKTTGWETYIDRQSEEPFILRDDTGAVLIDPKGAEIAIPDDKQFIWSPPFFDINIFKRHESPIPLDYLENFNGINTQSFDLVKGGVKDITKNPVYSSNVGAFRYTQWAIKPRDHLYIMGTAGDNPHKKESSALKGVEDVMISKGQNVKFYYISNLPVRMTESLFKWKAYGGLIVGFALTVISMWLMFGG